MADKKMDAEAKLWAKELGAGSLGDSWMRVLSVEFKQQIISRRFCKARLLFVRHVVNNTLCS